MSGVRMSPASDELGFLIRPFPHGRTKGRLLDWLALRYFKARNRVRDERGRRPRPHPRLLGAAVELIGRRFPEPVCVETGCIRDPEEGTDSTLVMAAALRSRGRLYTFELDPAHMATCREVCRAYDSGIEYVLGDAKEEIRRLREDGTLRTVHLAFLDSAEDPDQIMEEFRALEDLFVPGSLLIVDDVIFPAIKGARVRPHIDRHPDWDAWILYAWHGLLVADRH